MDPPYIELFVFCSHLLCVLLDKWTHKLGLVTTNDCLPNHVGVNCSLTLCFDSFGIIYCHGKSLLLMHLLYVSQAGSNEHDDSEELVQGICAFLMGICINFNDDTVTTFSKVRLPKKNNPCL